MFRVYVAIPSLVLLSACEVARRSPDPTVEQVAVKPSEPMVASEPTVKAPTTEEDAPTPTDISDDVESQEQTLHGSVERRVDGRDLIALSSAGEPRAIEVIRYQYGEQPANLVTAPREVAILATKTNDTSFFRRDESIQGPFALESDQLDIEAALLGAGIKLLERQSWASLQREHFFQQASLAIADFANYGALRADPGTSPGSKERRAPLDVRIVGRDARLPGMDEAWWRVQGGMMAPLLHGGSLSEGLSPRSGRFLSAKTLLQVTVSEPRLVDLRLLGMKPVAKAVPYVPVTEDGPSALKVNVEAWIPDDSDSYRFRSAKKQLFFDPVRKCGWVLAEAWTGGEVGRGDYVRRRTGEKVEVCPICGDRHATRVAPDLAELPAEWACEACGKTHPVQYLDGYCLDRNADMTDQTVVSCEWVQLGPGLYPLATTASSLGDLAAGLALPFMADSREALAAGVAEHLSSLLQPGFCWIRNDGSALVVPLEERDRLAAALQSVDVKLPRVDARGRQKFALQRAAYEPCGVEVPMVSIQAQIRAVDVETGELVSAGSLRRSYSDILPSAHRVRFTSDGVDWNQWPTVEEQAALLRVAICKALGEKLRD